MKLANPRIPPEPFEASPLTIPMVQPGGGPVTVTTDPNGSTAPAGQAAATTMSAATTATSRAR